MKEFQLIRQIQRQTSAPGNAESGVIPGVILGIGDDAAVLEVPQGQYLVAATDTLNAGVHFPENTEAFDIGYKCLAVNLSDMAAMGAVPRWVLLSLSLPGVDPTWVEAFTDGFNSLAQAHGVALVGGDTTRGPLSISITALGLIGHGRQLTRSGAMPGDLIVVSGTLGGAARALAMLLAGKEIDDRQLLDRPQPRVNLGQALAGHATACIDISDGLLADLGHVLGASGCGARIHVDKLPAADNLSRLDDESKWNYQLAGGDDYELLFTLPPEQQAMLEKWSAQLDLRLSIIGEIEQQVGSRCRGPDGSTYNPRNKGFEHFE
jgi:thiamine-monophosphate kinase